MKALASKNNILKVTEQLRTRLQAAGQTEHCPPACVLFQEDAENAGVYLVNSGKVRLCVKHLPNLDRDFGEGSLLGLPSTFTGHRYSLSAITMADSEVVHIGRDEFLRIMREQPELCQEATDMLGREVTFIQSALVERHRQMASSDGHHAMG
jgi:CRP-like cAMP-binding protein